MNTFAVVAIFAVLASANAGLIAAPSAKIVQGPSTRTTVVGPDGSAISSVAPGGTIIQEEHPGVVAHTAPVVAAPVVAAHTAYAAPVVAAHTAYAAPVVAAHTAYAAPVVAAQTAYAAPALAYSSHGVVAHSAVDTVVAGPSGTIATSKALHAPGLVAHPAPLTYAHHGLYF
ncbi:hypothetical protein BDFB_010218 [Asbolus verrucosus]|uniref:Uncharacterized protein n=1 Tax=Asbolus verrucosus TaxID=1661398 RepID=A0A482VCN0_ASBVE|nr:hypothetical protein BDFB_010218 [Asbolus verrucosus]